MGDERLAQEAGAGNERAFTTLFQRYHQQLYRYCRGLTGSDHDAQDALQTTFTKALIAMRQGRRNAPLRPWLYRIAHNEAITVIRGRNTAVGEIPLDLAASQGVTDSAEERERMAMLLADLRELPEQQRGALVMRELSGLSHEEIAAALDLSVGAAKQSILEARRSLLEFSEGRAMTCDEIQRIVSEDDRRSLRSRRVRAHMRDCATCAAFADAIPRRRADMLALWPVLPAASSAGLLAQITGAGSGHGGGGAGLAAGGAAKGIGATISIKAATVTTVAVLASASAGAVAVLHHSAAAPSPRTLGVSQHKASVSGQGSAVTRAAASALHSASNHQAIGKGLGPAAGKHAAGHSSHGTGKSHSGSNHNGHNGGPSTPNSSTVLTKTTGSDKTKTTGSGKTITTGPNSKTVTTGSGRTVTTGPHSKTVTTGSGKTKTTGSAKTRTTRSGRTVTSGPHSKTVTSGSGRITTTASRAVTPTHTATTPTHTATTPTHTATTPTHTTTSATKTTAGGAGSAGTKTVTNAAAKTTTTSKPTATITTAVAQSTTIASTVTMAVTNVTTTASTLATSTAAGPGNGQTPPGQTVTSGSGKNSK